MATNVLLTCAGRRNYLIEHFRSVRVESVRVFAADADEAAPALAEADRSFVLPPIDAADYIDRLVELCERHDVDLLVSLNDHELPLIANARERFLAVGTDPVVSDPEVIDTCFDKYRTAEFLTANGLGGPRTVLDAERVRSLLEAGDLVFPLVVKPRWGTASFSVEIVHDLAELRAAETLLRSRLRRSRFRYGGASDDADVVFQEHLDGAEYGIDVVNDLEGQTAAVFGRRKLSMRAGETDRAAVCTPEGVREAGEAIGRALRHRGVLDCDVFVTTGGIRVLELNPRFGGGYPFSHAAGADVPSALVAWANDLPVEPEWFRPEVDVVAAKCDRLVLSGGRGTNG